VPQPPDRSFVDLLRRRAAEHPHRRVFTRWNDDAAAERHETYGELDARVRAVAASLQERGLAGERVMLLVTPGLEYVTAFLGCLYAGAVAVPYYPPSGAGRLKGKAAGAVRYARGIGKVQHIAATADIAAVLMHAAGDDGIDEPLFTDGGISRSIAWLRVRELAMGNPQAWRTFSPEPESLAFLQFTSGSTGTPRGVMVSHGNLIHNSGLIRDAFGHTEGTLIGAIWLPPFHDMGLIGGILQPLFVGGRCVLLSPAEFLQRPRRWLEAITRHRATTSGGPNFAYDLCVRRVPREQREGLDLSSWTVAFTGAEPVRADTMRRFSDAFAASSFENRAFFPCYGLAEATLAVTGGGRLDGPVVAHVDRAALARNEVVALRSADAGAQPLVACGTALGDQHLSIVDPITAAALPPGRVGELWVRGPSVTGGYWNDPAATSSVFSGRRSDGTGPFLRTGDLGCLDEHGRLFIVGRSRDLIIIHGTNHHPADIEQTVEAHLPVIRTGGVAAFGVAGDAGEQLVVVAELDPKSGASRDGRHDPSALNAIAIAIRTAVLEGHDVEPSAALLVVAGGLPRTTSGKLERYACRERFARGEFPILHGWQRSETAAAPAVERRLPVTPLQHQLAAIWCGVLGTAEVGLDDDFFESGGHSLLALALVDRLSAETGMDVPLRTLLDHSKFEDLAEYLQASIGGSRSATTVLHDARGRLDPFPLTDIQEAYLFGRSPGFELGGVSAQGVAEFEAQHLDVDRLGRAVDRLVMAHDMLRAVIRPDGQQVLPQVPAFVVQERPLNGESATNVNARLGEIRDHLNHSMLLADRWPLFEIIACRLDPERWRVFFRFDLLIADLHSLRQLWRDLGVLYEHPAADLPAPALSFRDCVLNRPDVTTQARDRSVSFWRERLPGLPPAPELPYVQPFRNVGVPRFRRRTTILDADQWTRMKERAARAHVTPTAVLLAAFADVLATWSRHPRFTLALTFFNRPSEAAAERLVGDFTSLLLLGVEATGREFLDLARCVQQDLWEALDHRHAGGVWTLREAARQQARTAQALYPVVFTSALGQTGADATSPWSWFGEMVESVSSTPQVTLDHQVQEDGNRLLLTWDAVEALFPAGTLDEMFDAYVRLLAWLAHETSDWHQPHAPLVPASQLAVIAEANRTDAPLEPVTLHRLFLRRAALQPERPAVIAADGWTLTYDDLERRAREVAAAIRARGIGAGAVVAVGMQKGWAQVVATLGALRAGAAYVPVDPALPEARRRHVLDRVGARLILTDRASDGAFAPSSDAARLVVDDCRGEDVEWTDDDDDWRRLAYIIFTSGSTGLPKGVMIDHRGAVNTIADLNARFRIGPDDRVLGISGLGFDLSVYDIFGTLAAGGTLVLPAPGTERDPGHWLALLATHHVTLWNSVPALFEMLCEHASGPGAGLPSSLRLVWMSGDWIPVTLPDRARALKSDLELVSMGGATEGSIWSILYPIGTVPSGSRSIPYGCALANQRMHVFDRQLVERPSWVAGDIHIGGDGVALGYWRDPEKTAASFFTHPATGERLYRTGDVGRWLPDGNIEFLGREDGQVKIGGLRIELGEIEAALAAHPDVRQCAVVARHLEARGAHDASAASTRQIVAFAVPSEGRSLVEDDIRAWLALRLPSGMLPRRIVTLGALPLSPNGKVDQSRLTVPAPAGRRATKATQMSAEASEVRRMWADALGVAEEIVGVEDNFFDLGGTSVDLVRVATALSHLAGRPISVLSLFDHPTIDGMVGLLSLDPADRPAVDAALRASRRKHQLSARRASVKPSP
jgi:amino acid adenylation domain-containing protein